MPNNLLLTGRPGVGKTTIIRAVAQALGSRAGGFYTEEVRERGRRVGFRIVTLDGRTGWLAHTRLPGRYRVGKYNVNTSDLEKVGVTAVRRALGLCDVVIIDEIGPMELYSPAFKQVVMGAMDSPIPLVATIMSRFEPWTYALKVRNDTEVWEVTVANRDVIPARVLAWLNARLSTPSPDTRVHETLDEPALEHQEGQEEGARHQQRGGHEQLPPRADLA